MSVACGDRDDWRGEECAREKHVSFFSRDRGEQPTEYYLRTHVPIDYVFLFIKKKSTANEESKKLYRSEINLRPGLLNSVEIRLI